MAAVTVVITSYNQGPLIREAVESALSQTVRPERIIIVDDGSDEQTSVDVLRKIKYNKLFWKKYEKTIKNTKKILNF